MSRRRWVSGLRLMMAGLRGHFRRNRYRVNSDAVLLDTRQYRRYERAVKKLSKQGVAARVATETYEKVFHNPLTETENGKT